MGVGEVRESNQTVVLDVGNVLELNDKQRVDAINNFDLVRDFDTAANNSKSKFLTFQNRSLTDFTRCKTNRVLVHDDISSDFSSDGFESISTVIETLTEDVGNYLIQVVDPDTQDAQLVDLVTLTTENNAYLLTKTDDFTTTSLGVFETQILNTGVKNLLFTPTEAFTKDHDIKVLKADFNTDLTGINTTGIGNLDLTGVNVGVSSASSGFTTTTIVEYPKTDFNSLYATIFVQDSVTKAVSYTHLTLPTKA